MMYLRNSAYFTYNTLATPGHTDVETITEALCAIGIHPDRIAVHPQTVNVTGMSLGEVALMGESDLDVHSTTLPGSIIPAGFN